MYRSTYLLRLEYVIGLLLCNTFSFTYGISVIFVLNLITVTVISQMFGGYRKNIISAIFPKYKAKSIPQITVFDLLFI